MSHTITSRAGTYALLLELRGPARIAVGRLGPIEFDAPVHLYAGSAFGPGGLAARLGHHLEPAKRPHWHVDHLRAAASVTRVWTTTDERRLECAFAEAALSFRGAQPVPGFGASDCRCASHLVALPRVPRRASFRRHLCQVVPAVAPISELVVD